MKRTRNHSQAEHCASNRRAISERLMPPSGGSDRAFDVHLLTTPAINGEHLTSNRRAIEEYFTSFVRAIEGHCACE